MRDMVKRALVAGLVVAAALVAVPAAHASGGSTTQGGCFLAGADLGDVTGGVVKAIIGDLSATRDSAGPINATVSCWVEVNGAAVAGTRFSYSGFGGQAGQDAIAFTTGDTDDVSLCERSDYGPTYASRCAPVNAKVSPLQPLIALLAQLADVWDPDLDPLLCPQLLVFRGNYGPLTIGADGDVSLDDPIGLTGGSVWDCPPYDEPGAQPPSALIVIAVPST